MEKDDTLAFEIGERIRSILKTRGVTVGQVAKAMGISEDALRKTMQGNSAKGYAKLARLARALQTTPNDMLGFPPSQPSGVLDPARLSGVIETLAERMSDLDEDEIRSLVRVVLEVSKPPATPAAGVPPETEAKIQAEFAIRQLLRPKPS